MTRQPFQLNYIFFPKKKKSKCGQRILDVFRTLFQKAKSYEHT